MGSRPPVGWRPTKLAAVSDLLAGFAFKSKEFSEAPEDIRLLRGDNIGQGYLRWNGARRWPADRSAEVTRYALAPEDVVLAMDRPWIEAGLKFARVTPSDLPALLVQRVCRLRGHPRTLDQRYLAAIIGSPAFERHVQLVTTGSAVPHISGSDIVQFAFELPPLSEQRAITEVLSALDDKIESNTRVATAGLDMMRLDFDRRFGPTGELMQPCQALETVAEVVMGQSPPGATYSADSADGMPMVQGMGAFGERFVEPTTFTSSPTKVVAAGTLLMTVRAPVGSLNLTTERTCVGRGVAALATEWPAFVECSLREMAPGWQSEAGGTIYPSVNGRQVREAPVTAADRAGVDAFEEFATPLRDRALALHHEARHLTAIRDALLPRLVSGRIRVPLTNDLDEAVETVLDAA